MTALAVCWPLLALLVVLLALSLWQPWATLIAIRRFRLIEVSED